MKHYYDPMLFACTPDHPCTTEITIVLHEEIDEDLLREAVESLRERFPYFYVRPAIEENDLVVVPNSLPITVRNSWEPTLLMSREVNYHILAFKYEGATLAMEMCHLITDGAGTIPFFKSVLFCYLSRKTGKTFDPEGFKLPGQEISEAEVGDPFPGLDLESAKPFYKKKTILDFYQLKKRLKAKEKREKAFYLKIPEEGLLRVCKENDGTPNVLLAVLLARAVRRLDPESQKTILCAVAINHKAMLGNYDNYRTFSDTAVIDFQKKYESDDLARTCTIARGQLMLQAQPENSAYYIKQVKEASEMMGRIPLPVRTEIMKKILDLPRATFGVSYPGSQGYGPLDPYIKELYYQAEATVYDVLLETACLNHTFFLVLTQNFASEDFVEAFIEESNEVGITVEVTGKDTRRMLSGVRFDDVPGMKTMSESFIEGLSDMEKKTEDIILRAGVFLKRIVTSPL